MERFNTSIKGYNISEVNKFVDETIKEYGSMLGKLKSKDEEINNLKNELERIKMFSDNSGDYTVKKYEDSLEIKSLARSEADRIVRDAKNNASRIVNDALLEAERIELKADNLRRNMTIFKRKLRNQLQLQLQSVEDLDDIKLDE